MKPAPPVTKAFMGSGMLDRPALRIWVDFTNTAHVIVLRPLVERLEAAGHEVALTARPLSHTVELLEEWGRPHTVDRPLRRRRPARQGGGGRGPGAAADRLGARAPLRPRARARLDRRARSSRARCGSRTRRCSTTSGRRSSTISTAGWRTACWCRRRSRPSGWRATAPAGRKLIRYPGLKEEYYLSDFEPDRAVLEELGVAGAEVLCVVRTAPSYALYLGGSETPLLARVLAAARPPTSACTPSCSPARTSSARTSARSASTASWCRSGRVDGRSLVALADVLVSAGGTMNREAAVLGTPVWSMFEGPLGGVDEQLVREGRLKLLTDPAAIAFEPKPAGSLADRVRRDPADLLSLALPGALSATLSS